MQPPSLAQDFFALFDLPADFSLDLEALNRRYRELQQVVHPDRYAAAAAEERRRSLQLAAHVNEAYRTLRHPLSRLRHLLELRGVDTGGAALGPEFLLEQMELRERLAEIGAGPALSAFRTELEARIGALQAAAATACAQATAPERLRARYHEMQFMYRLLDEVEEREDRQ